MSREAISVPVAVTNAPFGKAPDTAHSQSRRRTISLGTPETPAHLDGKLKNRMYVGVLSLMIDRCPMATGDSGETVCNAVSRDSPRHAFYAPERQHLRNFSRRCFCSRIVTLTT